MLWLFVLGTFRRKWPEPGGVRHREQEEHGRASVRAEVLGNEIVTSELAGWFRSAAPERRWARAHSPLPASPSSAASAAMISKPSALMMLPAAATTLGVPTTGAIPIMMA